MPKFSKNPHKSPISSCVLFRVSVFPCLSALVHLTQVCGFTLRITGFSQSEVQPTLYRPNYSVTLHRGKRPGPLTTDIFVLSSVHTYKEGARHLRSNTHGHQDTQDLFYFSCHTGTVDELIVLRKTEIVHTSKFKWIIKYCSTKDFI